jgi:hypothetical protein
MLAIRKTVAAGLSVAFAPVPMASVYFQRLQKPDHVRPLPKRKQAPPTVAHCARRVEGIKHVIYIQFDNVHSRDNPNVPSDLEQIPQLIS